ncbi:ATP-binding protein [Arthrobacter sulfonylureivorans]|uniref:ATP-binding protein n=1 Tax=Arthrobacter sulfonylureivorans TaxID=2486855 RepID=UPI0039E2C1BE
MRTVAGELGPAVRPTVLVGATDAASREFLSAVLEADGMAVTAFATAAEVLDELQRNPPDILLVDAGDMSLAGMEAVRRLSDRQAGSQWRVMLMATEDELPLVERGYAMGVSDYLIKPLSTSTVVNRVRVTLARSEHRRRERNGVAVLRDQIRRVSEGIRSTNDPNEMISLALSGIGAAFEADQVWIRTLDDERVPHTDAQWACESAQDTMAMPHRTEEQVLQLASALWTKGSVLTSTDDGRIDIAEHPDLAEWFATARGKASALAPLGQGAKAFGLMCLIRHGQPRPWSPAEISLLQHVAGNLAHGLIQGHLITAQQEVVEKLRELDQAKSNFVATVNHELRTPLTSITGYLELVLDGDAGEVPESVARMLKVVGRNATRLRELIEDMLTLSRMDFQSSGLATEPVDLPQLLRMVSTALEPAAQAKNVRLVAEGMDTRLCADGDAKMLEQVFANIMSNAVKFTPQDGAVRVTVGSGPDNDDGVPCAIVTVADSGIGIPEEDLPQLFSRFYRASNAHAIQGTGLGLAIVKGMVDQHRGSVSVESTVGVGTTFTITLPLSSDDGQHHAAEATDSVSVS